MNTYKVILFIIVAAAFIMSCSESQKQEEEIMESNKKIGVLIASHGSHSAQWREMLTAVADSVKDEILKNKNIKGVKSAFMEYTEPSIATRMKEFDKEGYTDVIVVPMLLTVSGHSFDDIPHILGLKSSPAEIEKLKSENIEVYKAKANVVITPLLDFPKILGENLVNRIKPLSSDLKNEACVLVAYGDENYNKEWTALLEDMIAEIKQKTGIDHCEYAWCGHIVRFNSKPTTEAIEKALKQKEKALVIPVLVAVDEMLQNKTIGGAIEAVKEKDRIIYKPDAILPDKNVEKWIIDVSNEYAKKFIEK
jgi:hypothetical protein